jgi:hypothetical protein
LISEGTEGVRYILPNHFSAFKAVALSLANGIIAGIWASGKAKRDGKAREIAGRDK